MKETFHGVGVQTAVGAMRAGGNWSHCVFSGEAERWALLLNPRHESVAA